ncbi:hypothetical protein ORV05_10715 [Amycolatopsis cynarae]|uniref:Uncharacterized protein n=1 Tax=Amycolatopsis cynarae TaxID=2995223 RepID=A0ABY7BDJ2_9PSEU|nr:hypothetical protein [Amycolatopsis sp. HUAS 11-8]WAL70025.1 hypothetical protein ORV05_10715 [Amycolatopsis sp. HUAS 11-8]
MCPAVGPGRGALKVAFRVINALKVTLRARPRSRQCRRLGEVAEFFEDRARQRPQVLFDGLRRPHEAVAQ